MVNIANLDRLITDLKENPEFGVNMATFFAQGFEDHSGRNCGTVGCIAGHCAKLAGHHPGSDCDVPGVARQFLELDKEQAIHLFYPDDWQSGDRSFEDIITTLENLRMTRQVQWP